MNVTSPRKRAEVRIRFSLGMPLSEAESVALWEAYNALSKLAWRWVARNALRRGERRAALRAKRVLAVCEHGFTREVDQNGTPVCDRCETR